MEGLGFHGLTNYRRPNDYRWSIGSVDVAALPMVSVRACDTTRPALGKAFDLDGSLFEVR